MSLLSKPPQRRRRVRFDLTWFEVVTFVVVAASLGMGFGAFLWFALMQ
jgi:hypothetical protein